MGFEDDPGREARQHDQEALDEIRRLFARNHDTAGHGRVTEHNESPEVRAEHPDQAPAPPRRST
jgi:hypothetical protein